MTASLGDSSWRAIRDNNAPQPVPPSSLGDPAWHITPTVTSVVTPPSSLGESPWRPSRAD